jgi:hypothetical protein
MARIESAPLPPTNRPDVPDRLEALLRATMAKAPHERPNSVMALGRALQRIETACGFQQTAMEVSDLSTVQPSAPVAPAAPAAAPTALHEGRIRPVVQIVPDDGEIHPPTAVTPVVSPVDEVTRAAVRPGSGSSEVRPSIAPVDEVTRAVVRSAPPTATEGKGAATARGKRSWSRRSKKSRRIDGPVDKAAARAAEPQAASADAATKRRPGRLAILAVAAVLLLTAGGLVAYNAIASAVGGGAAGASADTPSLAPTDADLSADAVPSPKGLAGKKMPDGSAVFSWSNPDPQEGDQYLWGISGTGVAAGFQLVGQPSLTIPADAAAEGQICVDVSIVRKDRRASVEPARACAE